MVTFLSPDGRQTVDSRGFEDDGKLRQMGYTAVDKQKVYTGAVEKAYSGWKYDAEAIGLGAMQGVPGLTGATLNLLPQDTAQKLATEIQNSATAHPWLTSGTALATGAGLIAASGGLGVAGSVGTTALLQTAAIDGTANVLLGAGSRFDSRAINHALSPQGEEKINAESGHEWVLDAAIGAGIPIVGGLVAKGFKSLSKVAGEIRDTQLQKSILDRAESSQVMYQGRQHELWQTVEGNQWHNLPREQVASEIKGKLDFAASTMEAVKKAATVPLSANESGALANTLSGLLDKSGLEDQAIKLGIEGATVGKLHDLRRDIDAKIDYKAFAKDPVGSGMANLVDARETASGAINFALQAQDPLMADSWVNTNKQYSNLKILGDVFKTGKAAPVTSGGTFWKDAAMFVSVGRLAGWGAVTKMVTGARAASKIADKFSTGAFAESASTFANLFDNASGRLGRVFEKNFYGTPVADSTLQNVSEVNKRTQDFNLITAAISHSVRNQQMAAGKIQQAYTKAGASDEIAARFTAQAMAKNTFLASKIPQLPGSSLQYVVPSPGEPSSQQQQTFNRYFDAVHDPASVLANPTKEGVEVMNRFYPDILASTQAHLVSEMRSGKPMTLDQQQYASTLLQAPVSALTDPATYSIMQTARQFVQQQIQQQQAQMQQAKKGSPQTTSQPTRTQALEG